MQQPIGSMMNGVLKVMVLRGSPERVYYSRPRFIVALVLALILSASVQWLVYHDHLVFVILRVFAELTMFMLAAVLLTAKVARFRLACTLFLLVLINVVADSLLLLVAPFDLGESVHTVGWLLALAAFYGASNTVAWALRKPITTGMLVMLVYAAAVFGLDLAFRTLYNMVALA